MYLTLKNIYLNVQTIARNYAKPLRKHSGNVQSKSSTELLEFQGGSEERDALTLSNKKDRIVLNVENATFLKSVGKQVFTPLLAEWQSL